MMKKNPHFWTFPGVKLCYHIWMKYDLDNLTFFYLQFTGITKYNRCILEHYTYSHMKFNVERISTTHVWRWWRHKPESLWHAISCCHNVVHQTLSISAQQLQNATPHCQRWHVASRGFVNQYNWSRSLANSDSYWSLMQMWNISTIYLDIVKSILKSREKRRKEGERETKEESVKKRLFDGWTSSTVCCRVFKKLFYLVWYGRKKKMKAIYAIESNIRSKKIAVWKIQIKAKQKCLHWDH